MLHCDLRVRWKVANDLRFRAAISEPKTPSFWGISFDLAPSTRRSLAIAIARFWCAKLKRFLRWHVCRVNFARKIFFELRIFLRKMLRNSSRFFLCLCFVGQRKSRKIPSKFPTKFSKFPCEKSNKNSPTSFCRSAGRKDS